MTDTNTTTVETVTERELFRLFLGSTIVRQSSYGSIETIDVETHLRDSGSGDYIGDEVQRLADDLLSEDDPFRRLEREIEDRESHLASLRIVLDEFRHYAEWHLLGDVRNDDPASNRYRKPSSSSDALAHPPHGAGSPDGAAFVGDAAHVSLKESFRQGVDGALRAHGLTRDASGAIVKVGE